MATIVNGSDGDDFIDKSLLTVALNIFGGKGNDEIFSGNANDSLNGGEGNDFLISGAGKDTLVGGLGSDYLEGGLSNDVYYVEDEYDILVEDTNAGIDLVFSTVDIELTENFENLTLLEGAFSGTGNELNNKIIGNAAANTLSGMAGRDTLVGGAGDDTYDIDIVQVGSNATNLKLFYADEVLETVNNGIDTMRISGYIELDEGPQEIVNAVTLSLGLLANVENIDISGIYTSVDFGLIFNLVGNGFSNQIKGSSASDVLDGGLGVSGSAAHDTLEGGNGDDIYVVDIIQQGVSVVIQDTATELANEGQDTLMLRGQLSLIDNSLISLPAEMENLDASNTGATKLDIEGNSANNFLIGNSANNHLFGGAGDDTLQGGVGADTLTGGEGSDTYVISDISDVIEEYGVNQIDVIKTDLTAFDLSLLTSIEHLMYVGKNSFVGIGNINDNLMYGGAGDDSLSGGDGSDRLKGGAGNDTLFGGDEDVLMGDIGDDTYIVGSSINSIYEEANQYGGGIDTVIATADYELNGFLENLILLSTAIIGMGNELDNSITGNDENNELAGMGGQDTLIGGKGNDNYYVEIGLLEDSIPRFSLTTDDSIVEMVDEGEDTINVKVSINGITDSEDATVSLILVLPDNVEHANANDIEIDSLINAQLTLLGNNQSNKLTGSKYNDVLDGVAGVDTLMGGDGDDTYIVDIVKLGEQVNIDDVVIDNLGNNTLKLRGLLTLNTSAEVSVLIGVTNIDASATGSTKLTLKGDQEANLLSGNAAANLLSGQEGNDTLIGGAGKDTLFGANGDDYYVVDAIDVFEEVTGNGNDTVEANFTVDLSTARFNFIENIILVGSSNINGFGSFDANNITGNRAANLLNGAEGDDSLEGGLGNDTLNGGVGADTMWGGLGNDTYIVDDIDDEIEEYADIGADGEFSDKDLDTIISNIGFNLETQLNIEQLFLSGSDSVDLTGNYLNNLLIGNEASNRLLGGLGVDTLKGGKGDDTYYVDLIQLGSDDSTAKIKLEDQILEAANSGFDSLILTGSLDNLGSITKLTLASNFEKIDASETGSSLINITGNALNNYLIGNDASNFLEGAGGNDTIEAGASDTLSGGAGNDTYLLNGLSIQDDILAIVEAFNSGKDTIITTLDFDLNAFLNIENLTLAGEQGVSGKGNKLANLIVGNLADNTLIGDAGNDTLDGGLGLDLLIGGLGNDTYILLSSNKILTENLNEGIDTVLSDITQSLLNYSNIENITLQGSNSINATGDDFANLLVGNLAANELVGGGGIDTLQGGNGDDIYYVNIVQTNTAILKLEDIVTEAVSGGSDKIILTKAIELDKVSTINIANNIEHLDASATGTSKISVYGNALSNEVTGNDFANTLNGFTGNDTLRGGEGADTLIGGSGMDDLYGEDGADVFVFNSAFNSITNIDSIYGFASGEDKIVLDRSFFTKLTIGSLNNECFKPLVASQNVLDFNDYIQYDTETGELYYDLDGAGVKQAVKFAMLVGHPVLEASDFSIVA